MVKLGDLRWVPLRVLKAKTMSIGQVSIELDLTFSKPGILQGFEEYASEGEASEGNGPEVPGGQENMDGPAMPCSVLVPYEPTLEEALEATIDIWEMEEGEASSSECAEDCGDEILAGVSLDEFGNLVCDSDDVEQVKAATSSGSGASYTTSPAWIDLTEKGLAKVPCLQGCGLCYNRRRVFK